VREKRGQCALQFATQTAGGRDAAGAAAETLDQGKVRFGHTQQRAETDPLRRLRQRQTAVAPAHRLQITVAGQQIGHLHQVIARDAEYLRGLVDGDQPLRLRRRVHQHTQCVVGKLGQAHGCRRGEKMRV